MVIDRNVKDYVDQRVDRIYDIIEGLKTGLEGRMAGLESKMDSVLAIIPMMVQQYNKLIQSYEELREEYKKNTRLLEELLSKERMGFGQKETKE